jgi:regulator of protease activity HflC (stomatin/prohibitin superfamily)
MLETLIDTLLNLGRTLVALLLYFAKQHPVAVLLLVLAIVRSFGTTVQTGWAGLLFSWGRAKKVLEPGFHPLIPIVQQVRQTPIRSVTLDLPRQRVTTRTGLVYEVDSTLVYHVADPVVALTGIEDVKKGCLTLMPLLVQELMREQTRESLTGRAALDAELMARAQKALGRWGLVVEQAGFSTIAPTAPTASVTQLPARIRERRRLLGECVEQGTEVGLALMLVAPGRVPLSRARARARERARQRKQLRGHLEQVQAEVVDLLARLEALEAHDHGHPADEVHAPQGAAGMEQGDAPGAPS